MMTEEQRQHPRKLLTGTMNIMDTDGTQVAGRVTNLSLEGFMLLTRDPVSPGQVSRLKLAVPETDHDLGHVRFTARCIWCQKSSFSDDYGAGFHIEAITPENRKLLNALFDLL